MNKIAKIAILGALLSTTASAQTIVYTVQGHYKEVDLDFHPYDDSVQVYDSGTQTWSWVTRRWTYPSTRYGKSKKAVPAAWPTMYYERAWKNGSIDCYCDTTYSFWTTTYTYDQIGNIRKGGYNTVVNEVQVQRAYQLLSIDLTSGPMAW